MATGRLLEQPVAKPTAIQAKPYVKAIFFVIQPSLPTHKNGLTSITNCTKVEYINVPQTQLFTRTRHVHNMIGFKSMHVITMDLKANPDVRHRNVMLWIVLLMAMVVVGQSVPSTAFTSCQWQWQSAQEDLRCQSPSQRKHSLRQPSYAKVSGIFAGGITRTPLLLRVFTPQCKPSEVISLVYSNTFGRAPPVA